MPQPHFLVAGSCLGCPGTGLRAECLGRALIEPGKLVMSTNPTLPPMQFVDSVTVNLKGMRITLGDEVAKRLCLEPDYIRIEFSAMIPGLQAGRWDVINTGIFWTEERGCDDADDPLRKHRRSASRCPPATRKE